MINVEMAAYNVAHDYPGGIPSLAPMLGISPNVLQNKVNISQTFHKLSLVEAYKLSEITQDDRIAASMAWSVGCVLVRAGQFDGVSDTAVLEIFGKLISKVGQFSTDLHQALVDNVLDQDEHETLVNDLMEMQSAGAELLKRVEQLMTK